MSDPHDEDLLRAALADGVPTPPVAPGRASGARRIARRARRRRTTGLLAAASLAVVAVVTAPRLVANTRDQPSAPPASVGVEVPPFADPCADAGTFAGTLDVVPSPGATSVQLCSGYTGFLAPADALETGVAELTEVVRRTAEPEPEPPGDLVIACATNLGLGYRLVFRYPDGTDTVVRRSFSGCGGPGSGEILETTKRLYAEQRAARGAPSAPAPPLACESLASLTGRLQDVTEAVACVGSQTGAPLTSVRVQPADLTVLRSELVAADERRGGRPCAGSQFFQLVGTTPSGDRLTAGLRCTDFAPRTRAIVDRLLAEARASRRTVPVTTSASDPRQVVRAYADLVSSVALANRYVRRGEQLADLWVDPRPRAGFIDLVSTDSRLPAIDKALACSPGAARPTRVDGWPDAVVVEARCSYGLDEARDTTFRLVRSGDDEPYRILDRR